jgi:hypothetical protein
METGEKIRGELVHRHMKRSYERAGASQGLERSREVG